MTQGRRRGTPYRTHPQLRLFVCKIDARAAALGLPAAVLQVPVHAPAVQSVLARAPVVAGAAVGGSVCVSVQVGRRASPRRRCTRRSRSRPLSAHGELHAPQLFASFWRSTQAPPHSVSVGPESVVHVVVHTPAAQTLRAAAVRAAQTFPHAPQLSGSLCVVVQTPLQRMPAVRALAGTRPGRLVPPVHRTLHPPQLALSVCSFTQSVPQRSEPGRADALAAAGTCHPPGRRCRSRRSSARRSSVLTHTPPQYDVARGRGRRTCRPRTRTRCRTRRRTRRSCRCPSARPRRRSRSRSCRSGRTGRTHRRSRRRWRRRRWRRRCCSYRSRSGSTRDRRIRRCREPGSSPGCTRRRCSRTLARPNKPCRTRRSRSGRWWCRRMRRCNSPSGSGS